MRDSAAQQCERLASTPKASSGANWAINLMKLRRRIASPKAQGIVFRLANWKWPGYRFRYRSLRGRPTSALGLGRVKTLLSLERSGLGAVVIHGHYRGSTMPALPPEAVGPP
jgi:hypothetical protein